MSEVNMDEETEKKLNEIFHSIKLEYDQSQEALKMIKKTNDLVGQVRHCQSLSTLFYHAKNLENSYKAFKSIKINNLNINLNSDIVIYTKDDGQCVAKIIEIIGVMRFQQYTPIIRVQWYYSKNNLKQIIGKYLDCIGEKELFLSDQYDFIQPDTIISLAEVLDLKDFDKKNIEKDFTFFSRSFYKNKQIIPPIQKWDKQCLCNLPMNPDQKYIQCDICQKQYHQQCLGMKQIQYFVYVCLKCKKQK
ncbi:unnamed protein product [Paramecium sonneborni]|uniref:Zinc finger PHD-type domain-containing protein n=1 Tax=Paramecium sonneborni TaxID=65129 RepID=A0A8S1K160_9CILI|nr:unnamed protein product [Paramecium sonneborni]